MLSNLKFEYGDVTTYPTFQVSSSCFTTLSSRGRTQTDEQRNGASSAKAPVLRELLDSSAHLWAKR
jgi:hypothetical protein